MCVYAEQIYVNWVNFFFFLGGGGKKKDSQKLLNISLKKGNLPTFLVESY